jgi:cytochrome c biogenesis protein ResB
LWRAFAAPQTLVALLGLDALAILLGTIIPQIPPQAVNDPQAWLAVQAGVYGQAKDLLYALGLFSVYHTFWFHLLLALTGLVLFVWCVEAVSLAWRATVRQQWEFSDYSSWWRHAPRLRLSPSRPLRATVAQLHSYLGQQGYQVVEVPGLSNAHLVAARRALSLWAEAVVYAALVALLVGTGIVSNAGWQTQEWQPVPGESRPIGHGTAYAVRLDGFSLQLDENGRLRDYYSEITWLEDGAAVGEGVAGGGAPGGMGQPAVRRGIAVRQVGYAPVVRIQGHDATGRPLIFQSDAEELNMSGQVEVTFPTPESQQLILVLGHDRFLALSFEPICTKDKPSLHIALVQAGSIDDGNPQHGTAEQQTEVTLHESGLIELENLQVEVELEYRPILRADYRPGMNLIVVGVLLAIVALAVGWIVPSRLLWIAVGTDQGGSTLVQILPLPRTRGSRWPQRLTTRLREMLADDA